MGNEWTPEMGTKAAHPNSRFTAPAAQCPCISSEFEAAGGVPISAIVFGGRREKAAPLCYEAFDWNHGTFIGSTMASETTAAAAGAVGVVRRDPMAMRPFIGYNVGDYFQHWINMGGKVEKLPKIFHVNWFRKDDEGHFMWPGFGDNFRVLEWIIKRCEGKVDARETEIGFMPYAEDINLEGLDYTICEGKKFDKAALESILTVDKEAWRQDVESIADFYATVGDRLPKELADEFETLKKNIAE
jgi:phosphoenolpyruvate carboxykinase (GTP)